MIDSKWIGCHPDHFRGPRVLPHKIAGVSIHVMAGTLRGTDRWFNISVADRLKELQSAWDHHPVGPRPLHTYASSANMGVGRSNGERHLYVKEEMVAFHSGIVTPATPEPPLVLEMAGISPNEYLFGIENEGVETSVWTSAQLQSTASVIADLSYRWNFPIDDKHVIPHRAISKDHPGCPGLCPLADLITMAQQARAFIS